MTFQRKVLEHLGSSCAKVVGGLACKEVGDDKISVFSRIKGPPEEVFERRDVVFRLEGISPRSMS